MTHISTESLWRVLVKRYQLTVAQERQFRAYAQELLQWNQRMNLTGYTHIHEIVEQHFNDSLELSLNLALMRYENLCDVGTGAGLPGIALKIKFPHLHVVLIEVNKKKISFLEHIIGMLALEQIEICPLDWRTFLRTTHFSIDLFCSRAAIDPEELVRMFKPSCHYRDAYLVYWAASAWQAPKHVLPFVQHEYQYYIAGKKRRLVVFGKSETEDTKVRLD